MPFGQSQSGAFPYSGPGDEDWQLPPPGGQEPERTPRTAGSPTGPFTSWPPPFQPAKVQAFVPSFASRPYQQWGDERQFQQEPQPWEAPGIYGGVGKSLSQIGSGFVAPMAGMLSQYSQAFMGGFAKGQEQAQRIRYQQLQMFATETAMRLDQEISDYRDVFSVFHGDPATGTGADPNLTLKGVGNLWDGLYSVARQYDDKMMLAALDSGNLASAENLIKQRDAKASDLKAANKAREADEKKREEEAPFRGKEDDPSAATDAAGTPTEVQPPAPVDASVPPEEPPAAGAPAPATPPAAAAQPPAEDNTDKGTGLDPFSTTPDSSHRAQGDERAQPSPAPIAGLRPDVQIPRRPIQVAEAGASDVAPSWAGALQTAQAAPTSAPIAPVSQPQVDPNWGRSQALDSAKRDLDSGGNYFLRGPIDAAARKVINDPTFKPTAKGYPGFPPAMTGYITKRAQEIDGHLQWVENNPKLWGRDAYNAIKDADPELATALMDYVRGDAKVPSASGRLNPLRNRIFGLGHKIDPTFNETNYGNRVQLKASITHGQDGRTLVSMATAFDHLEAIKKAATQLKAAQLGTNIIPLEWAYQKYISLFPGNLKGRTALEQFNYGIHLIAPEVARAQKGSAPTKMEIQDSEGNLSPTQNIDILINNINFAEDRMRDRFKAISTKFRDMSGGHMDADMLRMFKNYEQEGLSFDPPTAEGVDPGVVPMITGSYSDGLQRFLTSPRASAAAPGGGGAAIPWDKYFQ